MTSIHVKITLSYFIWLSYLYIMSAQENVFVNQYVKRTSHIHHVVLTGWHLLNWFFTHNSTWPNRIEMIEQIRIHTNSKNKHQRLYSTHNTPYIHIWTSYIIDKPMCNHSNRRATKSAFFYSFIWIVIFCNSLKIFFSHSAVAEPTNHKAKWITGCNARCMIWRINHMSSHTHRGRG